MDSSTTYNDTHAQTQVSMNEIIFISMRSFHSKMQSLSKIVPVMCVCANVVIALWPRNNAMTHWNENELRFANFVEFYNIYTR